MDDRTPNSPENRPPTSKDEGQLRPFLTAMGIAVLVIVIAVFLARDHLPF
jgi:hypothetical protein